MVWRIPCLASRDPPSKYQYKELVKTKISAFHENELRQMAQNNSKLGYLNVSLHGLRGRHHPALANVITASEVKKLRPHLKLLSGCHLTFNAKYEQTNKGSPLCPLCSLENETVCHIIAVCSACIAIRTFCVKISD